MTNVGAIAANLHEGSRTEYLAQYVFASFGTSVPVPRQEDAGVDLFCTLTERIGKLAWPVEHFTVQVKSTPGPLVFGTPDSVRWLIGHPHSLLLCCVDKKSLRFAVYHTFPRYLLWVRAQLPSRLELIPGEGTAGRSVQWEDGGRLSLGAPILDFYLSDLLEPERHAELKSVLNSWLMRDGDNLMRAKLGVRSFTMPSSYTTNSTNFAGLITQIRYNSGADLDSTRELLGEILPYAAQHFSSAGDFQAAARCALLLHHLSPGNVLDAFDVAMKINKALGLSNDVLHGGLDRLGHELDGLLGVEARVPPPTFGER
jgi:hypothetical protein